MRLEAEGAVMAAEGVRIVVLDRGRVKVGRLGKHPELAFHWLLRDARVIRRWGSSRGLEQIAASGPTVGTVLDDPCDTAIPFRAVVEILESTSEEAWEKYLTAPASPAPRKQTMSPH
jgi:hypothetical protein